MKKMKTKKVAGRSSPVILGDMIDGLISASNACSVLVHHLRDPRFMDVRTTLDLTVSIVRDLARTQIRWGDPSIKTHIGYKQPETSTISPTSEPLVAPTKLIV